MDGEHDDEYGDSGVGQQGAGEHDRKDRPVAAQEPHDPPGDRRGAAGVVEEPAEDGPEREERKVGRDEAAQRRHENLRVGRQHRSPRLEGERHQGQQRREDDDVHSGRCQEHQERERDQDSDHHAAFPCPRE